ncbi:MAG: hypothetical protein HOV66_07620 [Streptomycetaceae bacterium]|nr:hypothetical protein [Streptomycetaceae bacterium]
MSTEEAWLPDGQGLGDLRDLITEAGDRVHLRLSSPERYPRTACRDLRSLGERWTGKSTEVTCPACLELVHA